MSDYKTEVDCQQGWLEGGVFLVSVLENCKTEKFRKISTRDEVVITSSRLRPEVSGPRTKFSDN